MSSTRIRSLKPEFHTSPSTAKASYQARLLYQVLWHLANDYGYGETNLLVILGHAFPPSDGVTVEVLQDLLREVANAYGTVFYEVRGRYYYCIPTWNLHNRKANERSRQWHPLPDDPESVPDLRFMQCDSHFAQSSGNSPEISGGSSGTGELGSSGTGERWNCGTGDLGSGGRTAHAATPAPRGHYNEQGMPYLFCSRHPDGTEEPCGPCRDARLRCENFVAPDEPPHTYRGECDQCGGERSLYEPESGLCTPCLMDDRRQAAGW